MTLWISFSVLALHVLFWLYAPMMAILHHLSDEVLEVQILDQGQTLVIVSLRDIVTALISEFVPCKGWAGGARCCLARHLCLTQPNQGLEGYCSLISSIQTSARLWPNGFHTGVRSTTAKAVRILQGPTVL